MVRSLMLHCWRVFQAHVAKETALSEDPGKVKATTKKNIEKYNSLLKVERFIVFNNRTGQMATEAWLQKHITVVNGHPKFKHPCKQGKDPKILTLSVEITEQSQVNLKLDLGNNSGGPRKIRCFDLRTAETPGDLKFLSSGFAHMATDFLEGDDEGDYDFDEVDFDKEDDDDDDHEAHEDGLFDDAMGLEGSSSLVPPHMTFDETICKQTNLFIYGEYLR